MRKTPLQIFALASVLSFVGAVSAAAPDETLKSLDGYRQWASVRGEPGRVKALPEGASVESSALAL